MECNCERVLMSDEVATETMLNWCSGSFDAASQNIGVVLDDRGYIRLVDLDDYSCLDAGQKFKINFCPICGKEFQCTSD